MLSGPTVSKSNTRAI